MGHAWLDSLSEDWVSQPGSDASVADPHSSAPSPDAQRKAKESTTTTTTPSRIPRLSRKNLDNAANSSNILGERNVNYSPRRPSSKLSQELKFSNGRSTADSRSSFSSDRSNSLSTVGSVVQHKSIASVNNRRGSTPEWKRRLVYGDLSYGEQADLFTSAGKGLENIFKPPTTGNASREESFEPRSSRFTLPSSPPVYQRDLLSSTVETQAEESVQELPEHPGAVGRISQILTTARQRRMEDSFDQSRDSENSMLPDSCTQQATTTAQTDVSNQNSLVVDSRKVSGRSDVRNEDFSPILIERRQASNGKTVFGPAELPPEELRKRLEKLRQNQRFLTGGTDEEDEADGQSDGNGKSKNGTTSTREFERQGGYINFQRGGRSAEGSFRHHRLSSGHDASEFCPEESLQASTPKQFPTVRVEPWDESAEIPVDSPQYPSAPNPSPQKAQRLLPVPPPSTASPLKLFQPYDTFTNQTLLRRLSQFQAEPLASDNSFAIAQDQSRVSRFGEGELDGYEFQDEFSHVGGVDASGLEADKENRGPASPGLDEDDQDNNGSTHHRASSRPPIFGDFTSHDDESSPWEIEDDLLRISRRRRQKSATTTVNSAYSTTTTAAAAAATTRRSVFSGAGELYSGGSRRYKRSKRTSFPFGGGDSRISTPRRRRDVSTIGTGGGLLSEIKRPRTSPSKDPTPKRRRTLHKSDVSYGTYDDDDSSAADSTAGVDAVQMSHQQMQEAILRHQQRREARAASQEQKQQQLSSEEEEEQQEEGERMAEEVEMISKAGEELGRPRTPTPNQRSSTQQRAPLLEIDPAATRSPMRSSRNTRPGTAGGHPPTSGAQPPTNRKPSIRTEDFINEANKIMAMIRSKAGLASGLASLEESEGENAQAVMDGESSYASSKEPFSRPPSREGRPPLSRRPTKQEDPELAERLKKYEEGSEMGDVIASSVRSRDLSLEALRAAREREEMEERASQIKASYGSANAGMTRTSLFDHDDGGVISDPPNLRISRNPEWQEGDVFTDEGPASYGTSNPGSVGTNSTYATQSSRGSSRGSEARKTIAPESVLHLIPDRVGNMVLDRQRNVWIKKRPSPTPAPPPVVLQGRRSRANSARSNFLPSEASEDDPFAGIPDLSVDITMEMQNLALATGRKESGSDTMFNQGSTTPESPKRGPSADVSGLSGASIATATAALRLSMGNGETPSRGPRSTISLQTNLANLKTPTRGEAKISLSEDLAALKERRRLTISFSSPIAEVIQDLSGGEDEFEWEESGVIEQVAEDIAKDVALDQLKRGRKTVSIQATPRRRTSRSRSTSRGPPRHLSFRGQTLMARPVSRIDEHEEESAQAQAQAQGGSNGPSGMELSIVPENSVVAHEGDERHGSVSIVVTPARPSTCPIPDMNNTPIISQYVGTFSLSPMSEFTIHRPEETLPLEASYVVNDHRLVTGSPSKRHVSMSTRQLVDKIAEVEPFEPYWEDMRELELRDKQLDSLHSLDDFCGQLESLDVSNNAIRNLSGIPISVLHLRMANNQLSGLTAWGHLMNLQYVDVSNNALTSLTPLRTLVHLRSIKADNNQLTSLDGIKYHRGLQSLRARGNQIEEVDFEGATLSQLTNLDLKGNRIKTVNNLDALPALSSLDLEGNQLESFSAGSDTPMHSLRYLYLNNNQLTSLSVARMPHLRLLHADKNFLVRISGFSRARRIDSLSLREQRSSTPLDLPFLLSRVYEVRKLFLSGNPLHTFEPQVDFLNLQLLEVANCGLEQLPKDFGMLMPNLRVLNLNMNALSEIRPLRYIPRLKRLFMSGNRLGDAAKLVEVLGGFRWLRECDVRDNLVTLGFYAPLQQRDNNHLVVAVKGGKEGEKDEGGRFVLPEQDRQRDREYRGRLDSNTAMRRRLWEFMVSERVPSVRKLDGLEVGGGEKKEEGGWGLEEVVGRGLVEEGRSRVVLGRRRGRGGEAEDSFA
ncbi:Protein nud1 [Podospora pseudoanserina]|uniref:Protein nud1 n=1 Tax=Podospora pseudoanserina TaxID=2609844 RepID=A0ABR0HSK6_9PEZI|nr:Protein nud1 [Podospora pseudoanserina]